MKILFEEYRYRKSVLEKIIDSDYYESSSSEDLAKVLYVGYYYDSHRDDSVFILPKVFLDQQNLFAGKTPEEILLECADISVLFPDKIIGQRLYDLSFWIYRAIIKFRIRNPKSAILRFPTITDISFNQGVASSSYIDIVLSLFRFYRENRALFTRIAKISHSGYNRVNWSKTVSQQQPVIMNAVPFYLTPISKKKAINYDEEIIIIFYSVLNYLSGQFSAKFDFDQNFQLVKGPAFLKLLERGVRYMKSIRSKYFSDKMLQLWRLLYVFFDKTERIRRSQNKYEEILLVKSFEIVFEDMVDDLIGDVLPAGSYLKKQKDGKRIDHIYEDLSLFEDDGRIYFIGDSKYYSVGSSIGRESVAKQFTYAKNVIQYNIDELLSGHNSKFRYRDELTRGYNVTPNFFIKGTVDHENYSYESSCLKNESQNECQYHFKGCLFDRDTLYLQTYSINLLYVLNAYVSSSQIGNIEFRHSTRKTIRRDFVRHINSLYDFHRLDFSKSGLAVEQFVRANFYQLSGKMYMTASDKQNLILALEKGSRIADSLHKVAYVKGFIIN